MSRYDLTDFEWCVIQPLLPNKPRGVPPVDDRRVLDGIFSVLRSEASWRDLPERYERALPSFVRWRKASVWDRLIDAVTAAHHDDIQMIDPRPMPPAHFALLRPRYRIAPSSGSRFAEGGRSPLRRCRFYPPNFFAMSSSIG
jgi:transposase